MFKSLSPKCLLLCILLAFCTFTIYDIAITDGSDYICGDINADGQLDIADLTHIVAYFFQGGPEPANLWAADCDGNGQIDISDLMCFIRYMFEGGPDPACPLPIHLEFASPCIDFPPSGDVWLPEDDYTFSSGCLNMTDRSFPTGSMFALLYGNDLHIYHINAYYQCCLEYQVDFAVSWQEDVVRVIATESDIGEPCDCMCYFNLGSVLPDMVLGQPVTIIVTLIGIEGNTVGIDTVEVGEHGYMFAEAVGNSILISHMNAFYNCCLDYQVEYEFDGNNITAYEYDRGDACFCMCYFNLHSAVYDLEDGEYIVTLIGDPNWPTNGDTIGVDTVTVPGLIGGPCSYAKFPGLATIVSVEPAPPDAYNCDNAVEVTFDFVPHNPADLGLYMNPGWPDQGRKLTTIGGANPSLEWVELMGLTVGSIHPAVRMEITEGTCTPVIHKLLDIDYATANDYCWDR